MMANVVPSVYIGTRKHDEDDNEKDNKHSDNYGPYNDDRTLILITLIVTAVLLE